jgi:hypothetical protein
MSHSAKIALPPLANYARGLRLTLVRIDIGDDNESAFGRKSPTRLGANAVRAACHCDDFVLHGRNSFSSHSRLAQTQSLTISKHPAKSKIDSHASTKPRNRTAPSCRGSREPGNDLLSNRDGIVEFSPGTRTLDECEWPTQNQTPHLR